MRTILIIDDDPLIRELLSSYLDQEGFRSVTAADGRSGLVLFDAEGPDAVLCDLSMPGIGGLGVLAEVRRRSPLTPFVVFTGSNDLGLAVEALRQGAWDYLLKPLPGLELLPPLLSRMEERAHLLREKELSHTRLEEQIKVRTAQLTRQLKEKDLLLAEVHHRVKNNLQIIQVLLSLQQGHSVNSEVQKALETSQNRIHLLALVQEEMHDAEHAVLVNARNFGANLVNHLLSAHGLTSMVEVFLDIEDLSLNPDQAFTCGLVVNELLAGLAHSEPAQTQWSLSFALCSPAPGMVELTLVESRGLWAEWIPGPGKSSEGWELVTALVSHHGGGPAWSPASPGTITVRLS